MKNSLMVGLIALKDSIYKGDTMKKLLQKWLGIAELQNKIEYLELKVNTLEANIAEYKLVVSNMSGEVAGLAKGIDKAILKQDELNALVSKNLGEIDGIKDILEYHTKELTELKKANKPKATPAKKA